VTLLRRLSCSAVVVLGAIAVLAVAQPRARAPILILVSFDGWRWDYLDRGRAPHLLALARRGVRTDGLIPSFPSKTFPNHYTIVTGLYPAHHGVVSNVIADPTFPERFTMSAKTSRDARWWGGEPIWVTAARRGFRAAPIFWPGSETPFAGNVPAYWEAFDDEVPNSERVARTLRLLSLPDAERPAFLTVYFSEADHTGHDSGPDSAETNAAIEHLDAAAGQLVEGVRARGLADRTTFVFVSDHGMSALGDERVIFLDDYIDLETVDVVERTPVLAMNPRAASADDIYRQLKDRHPALSVYRRADLPAHLHYRDNPRIAEIVGLADEGWRVSTHADFDADRAAGRRRSGDHGYDPTVRSMHGLFVAAGPRLRSGLRVPPFENIHVYDLMCELLGLTPAPNDGDPRSTRGFLKQ
jgi:predicted AlkP superfamily pyrophosphatase or phosphodiesterase